MTNNLELYVCGSYVPNFPGYLNDSECKEIQRNQEEVMAVATQTVNSKPLAMDFSGI